ncbi:hypothetical protein GUJ93_ZPchr0004g38199 [Zizania palustris]|uniref:Uncharacterized protein n=1 Tax=Zizania palustris TaxID=103762 RepID=A0A8J5SZP8_ZIZPA|nr:hypothetical protein GUJ93_ZPchr0004g38199 [Zizania palustris]
MEEISVELSAVSNPSRSRSHSLTISDISPEELGAPSDSLPLQATVQPVQHLIPANPSATPDLANVAPGENAIKPPSRQITIVYQRRHRRRVVQAPPEQTTGSNKASSSKGLAASSPEMGLRRSIRIKNKLHGFRFGTSSVDQKGKGPILPAQPSLQDFINATSNDASKVSKENLSADPAVDHHAMGNQMSIEPSNTPNERLDQ